jgi:CSLREA domain-containing protein
VKKVAMLVALVLCGALTLPVTAGAATITVNTAVDESNTGPDCSLREAIKAASTNSAFGGCVAGEGTTDTVQLASATYTLTGAANEDLNASGDLDVTAGGPLTINGTVNGFDVPTTEINGGGLDRIFDLRPDPGAVQFTAQNLRLTGGAVSGSADGGAIRIGDANAFFYLSTSRVVQNDAGGNGGAIVWDDAVSTYSFGVSQVQFAQNNADDEGGAIYIDTPQDNNATVENSSFLDNTAGTMGGAAYIESAGSTGAEPVLQFENSTLTGNVAQGGGGAVAFDFGLGGTVFFDFTTIAYNSTPAQAAGGGIFTNSDQQFVFFRRGTIIAGNSAGGVLSNCAGPGDFETDGYNLESGNSCHLDAAAPNFDLVNTNPLLGMTRINTPGKQTTETMALFTGSPAIDRVPPGSCSLGSDQRFLSRPVNVNCDVGAYEGDGGPPTDAEGDDVNDPVDNCPLDENANQANNDADFQGDVCDPDDDNDAVLDAADSCPVQAGVPSNAGCPAPPAAQAPSGSATTTTKKCKKKKKKRSAEVAKKKKCKKKKRK